MIQSFLLILLFSIVAVSCKSPENEPSEVLGNDKGNYFDNAVALRNHPKAFLEVRRQAGRTAPDGTDLPSFNKGQLQELREMSPMTAEGSMTGDNVRKLSLSRADANALYLRVVTHPVADLSHVHKYDPNNTGIGYCFGRAMTAHLEALFTMKLKNSSIRKLFAVGSLQTGNTKWGWHVTTIVRATEGGWWAIDPVMGGVISMEDWHKNMLNRFNPSGDLVLFHDQAMRFGPSAERYQLSGLNDEFYHGYFKDLLDVYRSKFRSEPGPINP